MSSLKEKIIHRIRNEGPISFETFMEMALYEPGLGYYTKDSTIIGRPGDFYTSSHLHPVFGAMIGKQMEEMWRWMGSPDPFPVVEMGAGMGYLARDMLTYIRSSKLRAQSPKFIDCLKYTIVELNKAVEARQRELLSDFENMVSWVSDIHELEKVTGCLISNELLDAFPVKLVEMDGELREVYVDHNGDNFIEIKKGCSDSIKQYFRFNAVSFDDFPQGYRTEINLRIKEWLKDISERLGDGFVLTIDYGYPAWNYYHEERRRGTFLCYYRHQLNEDPYQNIGEQDMTAQVNFSSLKKWGEELGLDTIGFCSQGTYLVSLGIDEVINDLFGGSPDSFELAKIKGLILPQGMGESHKVMVQYKGKGKPVLRGFSLRNQKGEL